MKTALVDFRISELEKENLYKLGYTPLEVPPSHLLYEAVCGHPDMLLHIADNKTIVVHKDMKPAFINQLKNCDYTILLSNKSLKSVYPYDICLNALSLKEIFLHNLKYTDLNLKNVIKNKKLLNVKQGYTKCSAAVVNAYAVMTSDKGIYDCLICQGIDVLLLPSGHIDLPGLNYGFIGGCCGLLDEGTIAFYGDLNEYFYKKEVLNFLIKHDVRPVSLGKGNLIDRGSIFAI